MTGVDCVSTAGGTEGDSISEKCKARALDAGRPAWIEQQIQREWAQIQGEWAQIQGEGTPIDGTYKQLKARTSRRQWRSSRGARKERWWWKERKSGMVT
jgi:hypothetical protein